MFYGGATKFQDQSEEEQVEAMAWAMARLGDPEGPSVAPMTRGEAIPLLNHALRQVGIMHGCRPRNG